MYEREREELVESIREKGIKDENVLNAMNKVPRHEYVQEIMIPHAYNDVALPIGYSQTISQPFTVAVMSEALKLEKGSKILEIGTGSGYQASVLSEMGMRVFSIERNEDIYKRVQKFFDKNKYSVICRCSDGTIGWSEYAPYDGIIVTAGSPTVPENLKKQLAIGGRLVIPVGDKTNQSMKILHKIDEDKFDIKEINDFAFVPLIGKEGWNRK